MQARQLGITAPFLGGDTWDSPALIAIGGSAVDDSYFSAHFSPEAKEQAVQHFVNRFRARWGELPDTGSSLGYDAVSVLADALRRAHSTEGAKIRDALATTRNFPGVTGRITMDAQRNASKAAVIFTIKTGQFVYLETIAQ